MDPLLISNEISPSVLFLSALGIWAVGAALTSATVPLAIRLAHRYGAIDSPGERKVHTIPTVRAGGLALFCGIHGVAFLLFLLCEIDPQSSINQMWWVQFFLVSLALMGIGLIDDIIGLGAQQKLLAQIIAASVMNSMGVGIDTLLGITLPPGIDYLATVLWYTIVINAFNLIDGVDGLASGLGIIGALGLAGSFIARGLFFESLLVFGFIGALSGFLVFNRHPAKLFLGDSGSYCIGFFLASLMLSTGSKGAGISNFLVPFFLVSVPILDLILAFWRRSARRLQQRHSDQAARTHIMAGDREHLHHRLLNSGMGQRDVTAFLCLLNALLVLLCIFVGGDISGRSTGVLMFAGLSLLLVLHRILPFPEIRDTLTLLHNIVSRQRSAVARLLWRAAGDGTAIAIALLTAVAGSHSDFSVQAVIALALERAPLWIGLPLLGCVIDSVRSAVHMGNSQTTRFSLPFGAGTAFGVIAGLACLHHFNAGSLSILAEASLFLILGSLNLALRYLVVYGLSAYRPGSKDHTPINHAPETIIIGLEIALPTQITYPIQSTKADSVTFVKPAALSTEQDLVEASMEDDLSKVTPQA